MGNTYTKIAETRNEWQRQVNLRFLPQALENFQINCVTDYLYF